MRAIKVKMMPKLGNPQNPQAIFASLFHSTLVWFAKWKSKWDISKDEGSHQQPSKQCLGQPYVRYAVRQKRANAKRELNDLLSGKLSKNYIWDQKLSWGAEEITSGRKDSSHSENPKRNKGWQNKKSFYYDDDCEQSEPNFSATFGGHKFYTWSWENPNFQSSTYGFEWRDETNWEKSKKRFCNESDVEDDSSNVVGLYSHRVALGLPPTGPLKLDDVKCAFRASALKWHPDMHQGPSQAIAGEKFKQCVDAYNSLCNALKSSQVACTQ
ncbi:uncharacterized protein LOC109824543 isoform X1 [Asparagus officinalis]|uniref:uncharacterized protein LOC109824543 isoform X1 n=1 Tax=Asparagus officinalis TaxID=4686 RepID=UPI00098DF183|nr:uncharacterized protein LOC109824543 isoform X1 [Asparagus officinalis]